MLGKYISEYASEKIPHPYGSFDKNGIPLFDVSFFRFKGPPIYHVGVISRYALAHYELWQAGNSSSEEEFIRCCNWLIENAAYDPNNRYMTWYSPLPLRIPKANPPWLSGMRQGQVISTLLRFYIHEKSDQVADLLKSAIQGFMYSIDEGGLVTRLANGSSFIEEIAYKPSVHILNGCLYGVFGIYEYLQIFKEPEIAELLETCTQGVVESLDLFDLGWWSLYSLRIRFNITDHFYHKLHIEQLKHLGIILECKEMTDRAAKWDDNFQSSICRSRHLATRFLWLYTSRSFKVLHLDRLLIKKESIGWL